MTYQIDRPSPCKVMLTATVPAESVVSEREHVLNQFIRGARIDGFRKGRAPRILVEKRFADEIRQELEEHVAREVWREVQEKEQMRLASPLGIREAQLQEDGSFSMIGEFEVFPAVELADTEGFTPPAYDLQPTDEEITRASEQLCERQASWEPIEGDPVGAGMLVEAEVQGSYPDGKGEPFHEEHSLFQIGAGEVYPEIEAAVVGRAVGDHVAAERFIGDEGPDDRKGVRIAYDIVIKSLRRKIVPTLDDAFAASMGVDGGVKALKDKVAERILEQKREQRREVWREALVTYLAGGSMLDLPESVVVEDTKKEMVDFARALAARGIDPEQAKVDWSKLEPEMRQRVERRLRTELLLDALADTLEITVPTSEVDREVEIQARQLKVPFAELRGNLAKGGGLNRIRAILRRERAADQILGRFVEGR